MPNNDLISRAAAMDVFMSKPPEYYHTSYIVGEINCLPTVDAAPVVRCKDCKNWDSSTEGRYVGGWCFCEKLQFSTSPDWFCADGERADAPTCGPDYCEIGGGDDE